MKNVVAVILAAGYGTRLQKGMESNSNLFESEKGKPKPLLTVGGYTVTEHWIRLLVDSPYIGPIIVVCNDFFKQYFLDWLENLKIRSSQTHERITLISDGSLSVERRKGAVYAMNLACKAGRKICNSNENYNPCEGSLIIAGDTLLHFGHVYGIEKESSFHLTDFLRSWKENPKKHDALIAYTLQTDLETLKRGILEVNEENELFNFLEKPHPTETSSRLACPPLYAFRNETIEEIEQFMAEKKKDPLESRDSPGSFLQWIIAKRKVKGIIHTTSPFLIHHISGRFDIGNVAEYKHALAVFGLTQQAMESPNTPSLSVGSCLARIGLLGNPSDGYGGKVMSCTIANFSAEVILVQNHKQKICFHEESTYASLASFSKQGKSERYVGGLRVLKATTGKFFDLCLSSTKITEEMKERLRVKGFTMHFETTIPQQVGLAGSSALICATMRSLCAFYQIPFPFLGTAESWPQHILDVEVKELDIAAGLMDRVVQVHEGLLCMDFEKNYMNKYGHGLYERLDISVLKTLPEMFLVYLVNKPSCSGKVHSDLRERWLRGDIDVMEAMNRFGAISEEGKEILQSNGDNERFCDLVDKNFDLRRTLLGDEVIGLENLEMAQLARSCGLACKFTGSGGAMLCIRRSSCAESNEKLESWFREHQMILLPVVFGGQNFPFLFSI